MAINLNTVYQGRALPPNANYPDGAFRNRTSPTAQDGTYLEQDWLNTFWGFFTHMMNEAGITPDGSIDDVLSSQYFDALDAVMAAKITAGAFLPLAGGTMTGATVLNADPTLALHAATKQYVDAGSVGVGNIAFTASSSIPSGYLAANGATISRATYADLFTAYGTFWGAGDGSITFDLPDFRGEFFRALDSGRGVDTGRVFGSFQADQLKNHDHTADTVLSYLVNRTTDNNLQIGTGGTSLQVASAISVGGTETRPRNIALHAIVKF